MLWLGTTQNTRISGLELVDHLPAPFQAAIRPILPLTPPPQPARGKAKRKVKKEGKKTGNDQVKKLAFEPLNSHRTHTEQGTGMACQISNLLVVGTAVGARALCAEPTSTADGIVMEAFGGFGQLLKQVKW